MSTAYATWLTAPCIAPDSVTSRRTLADRRRFHHQPRRQDRGRGRRRRTRATAAHRGRGECVPYRALRRERRERRRRDRGDARRSSRDGLDRARRCSARCRRAPRAMRSTARSGTSRPSAPASRCMSWPALPRRSRSSPPTRFRSATPEAMAAGRRAAPRSAPLLKIKLGGDGDPTRIAAVRAAAPEARADRRCQ